MRFSRFIILLLVSSVAGLLAITASLTFTSTHVSAGLDELSRNAPYVGRTNAVQTAAATAVSSDDGDDQWSGDQLDFDEQGIGSAQAPPTVEPTASNVIAQLSFVMLVPLGAATTHIRPKLISDPDPPGFVQLEKPTLVILI